MTAAHGDINTRVSHMKLHTPAALSVCKESSAEAGRCDTLNLANM